MKKVLAVLMLSVLSAVSYADEFSDGLKAWEKKDFATAHQLFGKLAKAGHAQAQLQLGEMYGFGEGVPEDMGQAQHWLKQAQANGNKDAAASIETLQQRSARKADIARYVSTYDGSELSLAKFGCVAPVYPEASRTQLEIKAVDASIQQWRACYDRFAANLATQLPAGKAIPPDLAKLMSLVELEKAFNTMDKAYAAIAADAAREGKIVMDADLAWYKRSEKYAVSMRQVARDELARRQRAWDDSLERRHSNDWMPPVAVVNPK